LGGRARGPGAARHPHPRDRRAGRTVCRSRVGRGPAPDAPSRCGRDRGANQRGARADWCSAAPCRPCQKRLTDRLTSPSRRVRLDQLIVTLGLAETRSRAQALLLAGRVDVEGIGPGGQARAGDLVDPGIVVAVAPGPTYVSRGGDKLAGALDAFLPLDPAVHPAGHICLDVGASTGGFTDVLLRRGATRVYALDVGRGQLAQALRADPRVI